MPEFLVGSSLDSRVRELEDRARASGVDYARISAHLPVDQRARAAALATTMGLNALRAIQEGSTLEDLEQERETTRDVTERNERESMEAGRPRPNTADAS
jgi:hypothetical protein